MNWKAFWITWIVMVAIAMVAWVVVLLLRFLDAHHLLPPVFCGFAGVGIFLWMYKMVEQFLKKKF